jgi:hypothetical protein
MTDDAHAWAREKLARAMGPRGETQEHLLPWDDADAVLALLPDLLTDERVVQAASHHWYDGPAAGLEAAGEALAGKP